MLKTQPITINRYFNVYEDLPSNYNYNKIYKPKRTFKDDYHFGCVVRFYMNVYVDKDYKIKSNNVNSPLFTKTKTMSKIELIYFIVHKIDKIIEFLEKSNHTDIYKLFSNLKQNNNDFMIVYLILSRRIPNIFDFVFT